MITSATSGHGSSVDSSNLTQSPADTLKSIALAAKQINALAIFVIADVMDRFSIDVEYSGIPKTTVEQTPTYLSRERILCCEKKIDKNSELMKLLFPICVARITSAFATPEEFVQNGIVFDFFNREKSGLLDNLKDEELKFRISQTMRNSQKFSIILKVKKEEEDLRFKAKQFKDGEWIFSHTAFLSYLMRSTGEGKI